MKAKDFGEGDLVRLSVLALDADGMILNAAPALQAMP